MLVTHFTHTDIIEQRERALLARKQTWGV